MPTALITGANRGLGLALARAYLDRDWRVIACVRDGRTATDLADYARENEADLSIEEFDLGDFRSVEALGERLKGQPVDVLISNAALTGGPLGEFGDTDYERWELAFRLNAMAPMKLMEVLADNVAASELRVIFALSSRIGANPFFGYLGYFSSKTALNMIVKQVSVALQPRGVTVVAAHPGWVATDATQGQGQAPLTPAMAAELLVKLIDGLGIEDSGQFFDPDGSVLPIVPQQHEVKFYSKPLTADR